MPVERAGRKVNPRSLENLKLGGKQQNYVTKIASQLNYETGAILAARNTIGRTILWAMADPKWQELPIQRREAILQTRYALDALKEIMDKAIATIKRVKDTPLRTEEQHQLHLRERRIKRRRMNHGCKE